MFVRTSTARPLPPICSRTSLDQGVTKRAHSSGGRSGYGTFELLGALAEAARATAELLRRINDRAPAVNSASLRTMLPL
jgi:hypothetical protein